jgi:hypothetical protein
MRGGKDRGTEQQYENGYERSFYQIQDPLNPFSVRKEENTGT